TGGCQYSSIVKGTVRPARTAPGDEPRFIPNLLINAWITCQNNTELRVTDNALRDMTLTRSELEQAIELRATLLSEGSGRRCAYVPDFSLADNKFASLGMSYLCPINAAETSVFEGQAQPETKRTSETRSASENKRVAPERLSRD